MSKAPPMISKFMTTLPHTIQGTESIDEVRQFMSKLKIRHLPVMEGPELIGLIADRDVKLALSFASTDPKKMKAKDICIKNPYAVSPETPVADIAKEMAEKQIGSAIVMQSGKVVGIFTAVDACRTLAEIIETRYHSH